MNRREFGQTLAVSAALGLLARAGAASAQQSRLPELNYTMLIHPDMVLLDLIGPLTVFNLTMAKPRLVWKDRSPVSTDVGIPIAATHTLDECPDEADVLFVPGGLRGTTAIMQDAEVMDFLRDKAKGARFVTSVCTGSVALAAAGLLKGKKATSHWNTVDLLPLFGAIPTEGRVVEDGNVITGGGVTAGLDFGLTIAARLRGDDWAKKTMLTLEYAPEPPFVGGTPALADPADLAAVEKRLSASKDEARAVAERIAKG